MGMGRASCLSVGAVVFFLRLMIWFGDVGFVCV
jgi:hypothetical protein